MGTRKFINVEISRGGAGRLVDNYMEISRGGAGKLLDDVEIRRGGTRRLVDEEQGLQLMMCKYVWNLVFEPWVHTLVRISF